MQLCGSETILCLSSRQANLAREGPGNLWLGRALFQAIIKPLLYFTILELITAINSGNMQCPQQFLLFHMSLCQESLDKTMKTGLESPFPCSSNSWASCVRSHCLWRLSQGHSHISTPRCSTTGTCVLTVSCLPSSLVYRYVFSRR